MVQPIQARNRSEIRAAISIADINTIFTESEINEVITTVMLEATDAFVIKQTETATSLENILEYDILSGFTGLYSVEYERNVWEDVQIENCDAVWTESIDGDVTATADKIFKQEGGGALKLIIAAGASAGDILATQAISSLELRDKDQLEVWIYATLALTAGDIQILLDDTALCASPLESLNVPVTTVNKWTKHLIALANPRLDEAIISVGVKLVVDGDYTLYVDDIRATRANSRQYIKLNTEYWGVVKGTTNLLKLTREGKASIGDRKMLRLTGYTTPALFADDATDSEIDPAWIIAQATARLLITHSKSSRLDIRDRQALAKYHQEIADKLKGKTKTKAQSNTWWF